jgi:hypothetical protein
MAEKYSVVFSGRLREGETPDAVRVRLAELFRVTPEQLQPLFLNAPAVLRRGLDEATAAKWIAAVEKAGGLCWTEPDRTEAPAVSKSVSPPVSPSVPPVPEPTVAPLPPAPPEVTPLAVPVSRAVHHYQDDEVVPFPKCPKCGRLPESTEDEFMRTGVCPLCGLIIRKYAASNFGAGEPGLWNDPGAGAESDHHWAAFWKSPSWSSYWRATWYLCCVLLIIPALSRALDVQTDQAVAPTIVQMAMSGLSLAVFGSLVAVACFYCFSVYQSSRAVFLTHIIWSAGVCAVLAFVGGLLSLSSEGVKWVARVTGIRALVNPVRALGFATVAFFGIMLYFGFVRLPAEKQLWEYLDGPEYTQTVKGARVLAGPDFPKGSRSEKYRYFRYVFVEPTRTVDPEFERILDRLLPDFDPDSFGRQHGSEVNLLVFNAIAFRDELAVDGLISAKMLFRLDQTAAEWERSRERSAARLVRALGARSPVDPNDLSLARRN